MLVNRNGFSDETACLAACLLTDASLLWMHLEYAGSDVTIGCLDMIGGILFDLKLVFGLRRLSQLTVVCVRGSQRRRRDSAVNISSLIAGKNSVQQRASKC